MTKISTKARRNRRNSSDSFNFSLSDIDISLSDTDRSNRKQRSLSYSHNKSNQMKTLPKTPPSTPNINSSNVQRNDDIIQMNLQSDLVFNSQ